jgi:hypothetical protein
MCFFLSPPSPDFLGRSLEKVKILGETTDCAYVRNRKPEDYEEPDLERATGAWLQENAAASGVSSAYE